MNSFRTALMTIALFGPVACSKDSPKRDSVQYGEPVAVRLSAGPGRPELEMALALAGGHGEPLPTATADALVRITKACPEVDSLAQTQGFLRLRLKVQGGSLKLAELPADSLAACAAKAIDGAQLSGNSDTEFDALAEIRAVTPKGTTK